MKLLHFNELFWALIFVEIVISCSFSLVVVKTCVNPDLVKSIANLHLLRWNWDFSFLVERENSLRALYKSQRYQVVCWVSLKHKKVSCGPSLIHQWVRDLEKLCVMKRSSFFNFYLCLKTYMIRNYTHLELFQSLKNNCSSHKEQYVWSDQRCLILVPVLPACMSGQEPCAFEKLTIHFQN